MANLSLRRSNEPALPTRQGTFGLMDPFRVMDELLRWDPFREMTPTLRQQEIFMPAFEVCETKDAFVFKADLPGVKESDIDISISGNQLVISGKRESESQEEVQNFYAYERSFGSFTRSFTLPQFADVDRIKADLSNGVLTLTVPKRPELQPRRISVGQGQGQGQAQGQVQGQVQGQAQRKANA